MFDLCNILIIGGEFMNGTGKRNGEGQDRKRRFRLSLAGKILGISILPTLVMGIVLTAVGIRGIREGMQEEVFASLEAIAVSVDAAYTAIDAGDYSLSGDKLMKGSLDVTSNEKLIDSFTNGNDKEVTLFYGDVRYATTLASDETGGRILGTTADPDVYKRVTEDGESVHLTGIVVNHVNYYACYIPMRNSDGSIAGMYFVGQPAESVESFVASKTRSVIVAWIIILVLSILLISFITIKIKKGIMAAESAVSRIARGVLNEPVDKRGLKRSDELGDMMRGVNRMQQELTDVVSNIKNSIGILKNEGNELNNMASQTSITANELELAVDGIAKSVVSQADDVENASEKIDAIGEMIGGIVSSVHNLDKISGEMKINGDDAMVIIDGLAESNNATMDAIGKIGSMVNATNESAARISDAIQLITSIAEETNLLSLNASIEAARAGEQGRGFAVVASQIQKLAEQSNESAGSIAETINELLEDSKNTVAVMEEVRNIVNRQQEKFEQTRQQFANVHTGIDQSREEAADIRVKTDACDQEKAGVVQIIANLSSVSEENASAAEETAGSVQELNSTISTLAASAGSLQNLSEELQKSVEIFKL